MNSSQHASSWYKASAHTQPEHPLLHGAHSADVCVVGAGITGLSTAIELAEKGYRVTVVEGQCVGWGASGRSGGQIIFGYGCEQSTLEKVVGQETAKELWRYSLEGVELVRERIKKYSIDCDYTPGHVHVALKTRQVADLQRWQEELTSTYDYHSTSFWDQARVRQEIASTRYRAGLFDANSGHLHPLNYTLGLAKAAAQLGVQIFENSPVTGVDENDKVYVHSAKGQVTADTAVLAGNAYLRHVQPDVEAKLMPVGTYITATEPLGEERCRSLIPSNYAVADVNLALDYFRCSADHRLLFGGRVSYSGRQPFNLENAMRRRMIDIFAQLRDVKLTHTWGGDIGITVNRAPHFGKAGKNIYFAQGYSGHGLAAAGLAGRVMAEAIAGSAERLDIFSRIPHRNFPGGRLLRTPALVLAMTWFRFRDWL
jgi:gamma-glutamylputrescine oxidase